MFFYTLGDIDATDVIRDFEVGLDKIGLDGASFGLAGGPLDAGRLFDESETVTGDGPALIYDDAIGRLYLDSDGAGAGGLQLMAILTDNPNLSHTDFEVFGGSPVSAVTDSDTGVNEIDADAVVGSPVAITASASDPDAGDTVSYSLTDNAGGQFAIDPSSGVVTLASPIPSGASSFSIEVTATSSDTSTSSSRFDIDVNTPPPTWVTFTEATTATGTDNIDLFAGSPDDDVFNGEGGNDWLRGRAGDDTINGDADNDRIEGGIGADFLRGGLGSDLLTGGETGTTGGDGEADVFFYTLGDIDATDVIRDFEVGLDKIGLDGASFGLAGGPLDAGRLFDESETVTGDGPALIYDDAIGRLYLDSDGAGAGGLQLMAILTGNPNLSHTDFEVFGGLPVSAVTDSDTAVNEIDADAVVGSPVAITASASDPDAGDTVSYSLTDNAGGQFAIDPSSGVVTLASPIPSGASSFSIEVTATSSDTSTSSSRFDIDVNTPPPVGDGVFNVTYVNAAVANLAGVDFSATPIFTETVSEIQQDVGEGAFYEGGPENQFAALYQGTFTLDAAGDYTFFLNSDDGSFLFIDDVLVIDNDGEHAAIEETVTLSLSAGQHDVEVQYYENFGEAVLELDWSGPDFEREAMTSDFMA